MGKLTDAIGLTDNKGAKKAAQQAAIDSQRSYELSKENIAFQREQYEDWKNIFGDIQTNLSDYYKSLTPDKVTVLGLENQQREFQNTMKAINAETARRGISPDSDLNVNNMTQLNFANATERARIRTEAPAKVAQEKLGFLGIGLNQGSNLLGNIGNAYNNASSNSQNSANSNRALYNNLTQMNSNVTGSIVGTGLGYAFGVPKTIR